MITEKSITSEWINLVSRQHREADRILVEKVIQSMRLLEGLSESGLKFIFKGGTSLMLLLNSTRRLSIDIDIIIPEKKELAEIFAEVVNSKKFIRFQEIERITVSTIPKAHYKFFYESVVLKQEQFVLLDILFDNPHYQKVTEISIASDFLQQEGDQVKVCVPSLEDLLGDKLTAYAPNTIGIPYFKKGNSQSMEIIKQLYDIGCIFNRISDLKTISSTFNEYVVVETGYRGMKFTSDNVLDDIFQTSLLISTHGMDGQGDYKELLAGISQIKHFIFSESYSIDKAISDSAKAAYLVILIRFRTGQFERFKEPQEIKDWIIEQPFFTRLNKLKKTNPEAFYYWYKAYELHNQHGSK
jgi:predicted nucleotidyltransferase component of viral defense system